MHFELYNNKIAIYEYRQIIDLRSDLINLSDIVINGQDLVIKKISKEEIIIEGIIKSILLGEQ